MVGGDLSDSSELNLVGVSLGYANSGEVLNRRGARPGDLVFVSRPAGLTPAALRFFTSTEPPRLSTEDLDLLGYQLTGLRPMVELGRALVTSGSCTSCMDNTDGLAQTLRELAAASGVRFRLDAGTVAIPDVVSRIAAHFQIDPIELGLSAGADLSLVGTISPRIDPAERSVLLNHGIHIIGTVDKGRGLVIDHEGRVESVSVEGWNYFGPKLNSS